MCFVDLSQIGFGHISRFLSVMKPDLGGEVEHAAVTGARAIVLDLKPTAVVGLEGSHSPQACFCGSSYIRLTVLGASKVKAYCQPSGVTGNDTAKMAAQHGHHRA